MIPASRSSTLQHQGSCWSGGRVWPGFGNLGTVGGQLVPEGPGLEGSSQQPLASACPALNNEGIDITVLPVGGHLVAP